MNFFEQFESQWAGRLGLRKKTFTAIFHYLAQSRPRGHLILETGCARMPDNWEGDGQSTYLFDQFANSVEGEVLSVDLDPKACAYSSSIVGPRTRVFTADSVRFLYGLGRELIKAGRHIDLLYLDSFDFQVENPVPSAVHHLKELCAIAPALGPGTLVVVDDSFRTLAGIRGSNPQEFQLIADHGIGGKAMFVARYFEDIGVPLLFEGYQCGWVIPD